MAPCRLTTTETQDADLILSQIQRMNIHEVPFCYAFRVNNTTLECLLGSRSSGQRPTHQSSTSLSQFTAKQPLHPPDLFSKQELSVRNLWHETKMMVFLTKLIVHRAMLVPKSRSASPNRMKVEKLEDDLRFFGKFGPQSYKKSSHNVNGKDTFIVSALDVR